MRKILYLLTFFAILSSCVWNDPADGIDYLPLDDSEYPYAGLPRLVIEIDNFAEIRDRETKLPARLQIYGERSPESEPLTLTVKGRGNSSFIMAKYGIKLEFEDKQALFGMPKNRDWDLVANQRDKSLLRNYITYQLADILDDEYAPRSCFVEVFLNREYQGIYQLTEHMKVAKNRINIPENDSSFWIEKTSYTTTGIESVSDESGSGSKVAYISNSDDIFVTNLGYIFQINSPKEPSNYSKALIQQHINDFEAFLQSKKVYNLDSVAKWIDIEDITRYYMIQEFAKNLDGAFRRSTHITWQKDSVIKMGPVWDFDLGYGQTKVSPESWYVRKYGWYKYLFKSNNFKNYVGDFWSRNRDAFAAIPDSIDSMAKKLSQASKNEFKRWPILDADDYWPFVEAYGSYNEAVDTLKTWIKKRVDWIDGELTP